MLRKIIASIRKTLAPKKTPVAQTSPAKNHSQKKQSGQPRPEGRSRGADTPKRGHSDKPRHDDGNDAPRSQGGRRQGPRSSGPKQDKGPAPSHRPAAPVAPPVEVPKMDSVFTNLGLTDAIAFAVQEKGYTEPTPIQAKAIPVIIEGKDVIGSAQTGTGKTAAFALPILQRLSSHGKIRCLVLEPTRELALQVEQAFLDYSKYTDLRTTVIYGGVGYGKQEDDLRRGMDILVATPGRLLDFMEQGTISLRDVEILVLDEVDRMLDMGFLPDVKRIVQKCPPGRQTLFFTATLPPELAQLAGWALRDPVTLEIGQRRSPAETVSHAFYPVVGAQKFDLLITLLSRTEFKSVILFCRTKMGADRVAAWLKSHNHTVGVLHADRNQRERQEALAGFKEGRYEVLVATDIAARGLDIAGVTHVINYDVPENPEDYVHRIGRTGRAQQTGDAFTLVTEETVRDARSIERYIGKEIEYKKLEDFPYTYSALFDQKTIADAAPKTASRLHRGMRR